MVSRIAPLLAALCLLPIGCSSQTSTPVHGTVTFDGEPVAEGWITFHATTEDKQTASGPIRDGAYSLEAGFGEQRVEIRGTRETGDKDAYGQPVKEEYLPERFNRETTLSITVDAATEVVDFPLQSEPPES